MIVLKGIGRVLRQLDKAALKDSATRIRAMRLISRRVLKDSKAHITNQIDLRGIPFKKRADGRRKKMLVKLKGKLKAVSVNEHGATLGFTSPVTSAIAYKHQHGHVEWFEARQLRKSGDGRNKPATRRQAKALLKAGYKLRVKGEGYKRPTQKWIMENMTIGRAGLILRLIRGTKQTWKIVIPARSFLGANQAELRDISQDVTAYIEQELKG